MRAGDIILVRHGRPALSRDQRLDWRGYRSWWAAYGESGLDARERPPKRLASMAAEADCFVASPLPRARETAEHLAGGREILLDDVFVEAPLPAPQIPFVRLKPGAWNVLSRISWKLGYSAAGESHKHAEVRAEDAATRLESLARGKSLVVLCAHGWFNRMIRPVLRARGWRCAYDGGDSYWAWRHYRPPAGRGR
ncbi:MAG: histidine phosphatase family protein [Alphaproteobacteria bacterium]